MVIYPIYLIIFNILRGRDRHFVNKSLAVGLGLAYNVNHECLNLLKIWGFFSTIHTLSFKELKSDLEQL